MPVDDTAIPFEPAWFRLGVGLAFAYAGFTVLVVALLRVDPTLALVVATVGGTLGALALVILVRYVY